MTFNTAIEELKSMSVDMNKSWDKGSYLFLDNKHINVIVFNKYDENANGVQSFVRDVLRYKKFLNCSKLEKVQLLYELIERYDVNYIDKRLIKFIK